MGNDLKPRGRSTNGNRLRNYKGSGMSSEEGEVASTLTAKYIKKHMGRVRRDEEIYVFFLRAKCNL